MLEVAAVVFITSLYDEMRASLRLRTLSVVSRDHTIIAENSPTASSLLDGISDAKQHLVKALQQDS